MDVYVSGYDVVLTNHFGGHKFGSSGMMFRVVFRVIAVHTSPVMSLPFLLTNIRLHGPLSLIPLPLYVLFLCLPASVCAISLPACL